MSWSLSASGHAELDSDEKLLISDLKEVFTRHKDILTALSFTGAGGELKLADIVAEDVVVPLVRPVLERIEDEVEKLLHLSPTSTPTPGPGEPDPSTPTSTPEASTPAPDPSAPGVPQPEGSIPPPQDPPPAA